MYIPRAALAPIIVGGLMFIAGAFMLAISFMETAQADGNAAAPESTPVLMCTEGESSGGSGGTSDAVELLQALSDLGYSLDGAEQVEGYVEQGDFATNSGTIDDSLFTDGGFGDIGQQWRDVSIDAPVTNVNVTGTNASAGVHIGDNNPAPPASPTTTPTTTPAPPAPTPTTEPTPPAPTPPTTPAAPLPPEPIPTTTPAPTPAADGAPSTPSPDDGGSASGSAELPVTAADALTTT